MEKFIVLLDNGHGADTKGKRSPDGRLREYAWTREVVALLGAELDRRGIAWRAVVPEASDVPISTRCRRVNAVCAERGAQNCLLVSVHVNAASGEWSSANGWMVLVDDNASTRALSFADALFDAAQAGGLKTRQYTAGRKWYRYSEALGKKGVRLGMLKGTRCPAVLTENLFMTNRPDVNFLLSDEGKTKIVNVHADAIEAYYNRYSE